MIYSAAVVTVSRDSQNIITGVRDSSLCEILRNAGFIIVYSSIVPRDESIINAELLMCSDKLSASLLLIAGDIGPAELPNPANAVPEHFLMDFSSVLNSNCFKTDYRGRTFLTSAGIRSKTLIVGLPGSEQTSKSTLFALLDSIKFDLDMLNFTNSTEHPHNETSPSLDQWLSAAKASENSAKCGMYLTHVGTVRADAKSMVRENKNNTANVKNLLFSFDRNSVKAAISETKNLPGIYYVRTWLNNGLLSVGDDIMYVLIGGDIRPRVVEALQFLVGKLKNECVTETELFDCGKQG